MIKEAISKLVENIDLSEEESELVMEEIMSGNATQAQIASYLILSYLCGEGTIS